MKGCRVKLTPPLRKELSSKSLALLGLKRPDIRYVMKDSTIHLFNTLLISKSQFYLIFNVQVLNFQSTTFTMHMSKQSQLHT